MYTIEAMEDAGQTPRFDCYSQDVAWALQLREKTGSDVMSKAYFGGDIDTLKNKVDSMGSEPDTWDNLNSRIEAYHKSVSREHPYGDASLKWEIDEMIDNLSDQAHVKMLFRGKRGR